MRQNTVGRQQPSIYRVDSVGGASDCSSNDNDDHSFQCGSGSHDDDRVVPYLERSETVKVFNLAWTDFPCEDDIHEVAERGVS